MTNCEQILQKYDEKPNNDSLLIKSPKMVYSSRCCVIQWDSYFTFIDCHI